MNRTLFSILSALVLSCLLGACAANKPFYASLPAIDTPPADDSLLYSVYLIGDTGETVAEEPNPALQVLRKKLLASGKKSAAVVLGDILYPHGLPHEEAKKRSSEEENLRAQLRTFEGYQGRVVFLPGNHDWNSSSADGLPTVRGMEGFIESYFDSSNVFLPDDGFPGPIDIKLVDKDTVQSLSRDIHLVALDTQWWFHPHEKPFGDTGDYDLHDSGDFLNELNDVVLKRQNDHLIVAGHHPLFSNGVNGGNFPWYRHVLPPIGGTAFVLYRMFFGLPQDIPNYRYQSLKNELLGIFGKGESLVYAAGHDHLLQHNIRQRKYVKQHYVVSGAGSKSDYAAKGKGAEFVAQDKGFAIIRYYANRSSWLEFWNAQDSLLYRRQLLSPSENPFFGSSDSVSTTATAELPDSLQVAANPKYDQAGWVHRTILGSHNRRFWSVPVTAPVFDISAIQGGLEAIKLGGTGQSTTLQLKDQKGHTYVLRSIDKEAGRIWDATLRNTFAKDLAQDQFSIINPYSAFMVPPLAEAAGLYHTKPKLFVIPDDPRLGRFGDLMNGKLALFEERPDDDMSHAPHLSGSTNVLSSRDMLRKVNGDIDHRADQRMLLKNRLLDLLISDWDRHDDQWRWAAVEPSDKKGKIYQPIPRDRDMAFLYMNGIIPTIGKISFFKQHQDFRSTYGDIKGLTQNSLGLSRRFTNKLTKKDWLSLADSLQKAITDSVIEQAVAQMPGPVVDSEGAAIAHILKERREKLPTIAERYYGLLARISDVVGSNKREKFILESFAGDSLRVQVYKLKKEDALEQKYFDRTYSPGETKEIRIFGLGGEDLFEVNGQNSSAFRIRIIGGPGADTFTAERNSKNPIPVYDTIEGSTFRNISAFTVNTSNRVDINDYNYLNGFKYNSVFPLVFLGSNRDDGLFIGGGVKITRHGFRKRPAAAIHRIRVNFAAETQAFNVRYDGLFADIWSTWDGTLNIDVLLPNNIRNFYGLGNETSDESRIDDFYQARLWQYQVKPAFKQSIATGISFSAGPFFQVTRIQDDQGRFVGQPQAGISENTFDDQWFTGLHAQLGLQIVDSPINPRQGFRWTNHGQLNLGVENTSANYSTIGSSLSLYWSPVINPQLTFAARFGIKHNIGPFPFYDSNTLGGKNTLRGLLSNRYAGRTSFNNNIESRIKLFDIQNYILGGELGTFGFFDHGRVWTDGERSRRWHYGTGGGLWMSLFNTTVIRSSVGFSEGNYNILLGAGFFF